MNAGPVSLVSLISDASKKFLVPVYQRPYSWDEEQCAQLWDDILSSGRSGKGSHFTGSVVWIQNGTMSAAGVTSLLLIDGQQRITTVMLLLVALADYARTHDDESLNFSYQEIIQSGFLVSPFKKKSEDHYRLTLSQGDKDTFRSIVDHLENPEAEIINDSRHLIDNLSFFRDRLAAIENPNVVWAGIQRLEVVSISLTQGEDNPQLIFESMNSTGKDLSTADLVRNYVLMGLPIEEQNDLYENYWRKIEQTLGADSYDDVFDDFLHDWLSVINAPAPLTSRDVYRVFKRYVEANDYSGKEGIEELLKLMRRYATYYADINFGSEEDSDLKSALDRLHELGMSVATPLLMFFLNAYDESAGSFTRSDLVEIIHSIESYLFRRVVCGLQSNGVNKYFQSLIGRFKDLENEEIVDYSEALEAMLLGEAGTSRQMPSDEDFKESLMTRDVYSLRSCYYLLTTLENAHHTKNPIDFSGKTHTIEHIMPQNALAHDEWKTMLGSNYVDEYQKDVNNLGNLTLTAYNSELSDGTFEEKKSRVIGGYENEYLSISHELHDATTWNSQSIQSRAERLSADALQIWAEPKLDDVVIDRYRIKKTKASHATGVAFRAICAAGFLDAGSQLVSPSSLIAVVTQDYRIELPNGEKFNSPSSAANRVLQLEGRWRSHSRNGWTYWKYNGKYLDDIRGKYLASKGGYGEIDRLTYLSMFWSDFYDYCSDRSDFVAAYGDPSSRVDQNSVWTSYGLGSVAYQAIAMLGLRDSYAVVELWFTDNNLYKNLLTRKQQVNGLLAGLTGEVKWDDSDSEKKSRSVQIKRSADFENGDRLELFTWIADALLAMRRVVPLIEK